MSISIDGVPVVPAPELARAMGLTWEALNKRIVRDTLGAKEFRRVGGVRYFAKADADRLVAKERAK